MRKVISGLTPLSSVGVCQTPPKAGRRQYMVYLNAYVRDVDVLSLIL